MDETVDMGWELPDNHFENEDFLEPPSELKNKRILSTADYTLSAPLNKDGLNLCLDALISGKPVSQCKLIPGLLKDVGKLSELDINKWTQFARVLWKRLNTETSQHGNVSTRKCLKKKRKPLKNRFF